jgi:hypothetical protein
MLDESNSVAEGAPGTARTIEAPAPTVSSGGAMSDMSASAAATPATAASTDASATVTTSLVTNGPVADTPENRAKYGAPLSNAGRRTAARGN